MIHDLYWERYDHTLARIRAERPTTFAGVKLILDVFSRKSSGDAFFPGGSDDTLAHALADAGWSIRFGDGDYIWVATHPETDASLTYIEGDVYMGTLA